MKKEFTPREVIEIIANYNSDIWNNPAKWKKQEWHLFDLYLYYTGLSFFQRLSIKRKIKKAAKRNRK